MDETNDDLRLEQIAILTARREESQAMEMWKAALGRFENARNEADRYQRIWSEKQERITFLLKQAVRGESRS